MFADNGRISHRQLQRQLILTLFGPSFFLLTEQGAASGAAGMTGIALGYLGLLLWSFFLVRLEPVYHRMERYVGTAGAWLVRVVFWTYLLFTGSYLLERMAWLCSRYLTAGIRWETAASFLVAAAFFGINGEIQQRGRLAEALYPWVATGVVFLLLLAAFHMRTDAFREVLLFREQGMPGGESFFRLTWKSFCETLVSGTAVSLIPFLLSRVQRNKSAVRPLMKGMGKVAASVLAAALVLVGTYGRRGVQRMKQPVLQLMSGTNVPGDFLERFDIVWMAILLCGLLFSLGSVLFYCVLVSGCCQAEGDVPGAQEQKGDASKAGRWPEKSGRLRLSCAVLIWLLAVALERKGMLADSYREAVGRLYLPVFLSFTVILSIAGRIHGEKRREKGGAAAK